jgi:hypothetical protein
MFSGLQFTPYFVDSHHNPAVEIRTDQSVTSVDFIDTAELPPSDLPALSPATLVPHRRQAHRNQQVSLVLLMDLQHCAHHPRTRPLSRLRQLAS